METFQMCGVELQFLRELHFIEAPDGTTSEATVRGCSFFGNCTSLRRTAVGQLLLDLVSQFPRGLHFIEASVTRRPPSLVPPVAVPSGTALH